MTQQKWEHALTKAQPRFEKIAESTRMEWAQESMFAYQIIAGNDYMQKCDPNTIRNAIINVASVGLTLNPAHKLAYLIPRDGMCCLDISYMGMLRIATDSGSVRHAAAELVYSNDKFVWRGKNTLPDHAFDPFSDDRGTFRGAYITAKLSDGDWMCDHMSASEVYKIRDLSKSYKDKNGNVRQNSVWVTWFEEMVKKTIIKRAAKTWPKSDRLHEASNILNQHEGMQEAFANARNVTPQREHPQELPYYPQEKFDQNFDSWSQAIADGRATPDKIIAKLQTLGQVTDDQAAKLRACKPATEQAEA